MLVCPENLYNPKGEQEKNIRNSCSIYEYEEEFCKIISNIIVDSMQIGWKDRTIVSSLLFNALEDKVCKKEGLLEQYLHSQLDILLKSFIENFSLNENIKTDYNHATHAKFSTLTNKLIEKFEAKNSVRISPEKEDEEEPHPMLCFQHGGSGFCEYSNKKYGFLCPKCCGEIK